MAVTVHVVQRSQSWRARVRAGSSVTGGTMAISDNWSSEGIWGSLVMVLGMQWMKGMTGGGEGVSSTTGRRCGCNMEKKEIGWIVTPGEDRRKKQCAYRMFTVDKIAP